MSLLDTAFAKAGAAYASAEQYAHDHPGITRTVAIGVGGAIAPMLVVPILGAVGFSASGVVAGSIAAGAQGSSIAAGSIFAFCQSAAMGGYGAAALSAIGVTSGIVAGGTVAAAGVTEGVRRGLGSKREEDDDDDYEYEYSDYDEDEEDDDESYSDEKKAWRRRRRRRQLVGGEEDENSDDESSEDDNDEDSSDSSSIGSSHPSNPKRQLDPQRQPTARDIEGPDSGPSDEVLVASNIPPVGGDDGSDTYEKMLKRVQARREARSQN